MVENRSLTVHYLFRAVIMAGFSFYVLHLVKAGSLVYYIAPRMEVYVKCAAIALFVIALYQGFLGLRSFFGKAEAACDCEHAPPASIVRNIWLYGLFLLPLTLGFLLPDKLMGSDVVAMKGMNLSGGNGAAKAGGRAAGSGTAAAGQTASAGAVQAPESVAPEQPVSAEEAAAKGGVSSAAGTGTSPTADEELKRLFEADDFSKPFVSLGIKLYKQDRIVIKENGFMELLTAVDLFLDRYIGKKMEITGFVYREPDMKENQFVVSRLAMMCCSADSSPYGVLVEGATAKTLSKDAWVKIVGTIGTTKYKDIEIMKLDATSIESIQAPETPYVYPYYEDFEKLAD
ncbi:TIGR03943 family protein [Paenibacillus hemerocallicola]|uniref:TIGR03943 family protein n=1 Tax=Paenibacillus hemerocallicola TaxID=1172614 RepID=A0A5C4T2I3_9BACL|nr:TIGR03943 family protein [Paenibacillus hemerocallicola]TNJ63233.1 TIGR03943 family protein [Paenibacillus hemerocallicola]